MLIQVQEANNLVFGLLRTYVFFLGHLVEFNISWLRGGHPLLNVGNLSMEASQSLGSLLDQLRFPTVKSLGNLVIVVLINRYFRFLCSYNISFFESVRIMHALSEAII